jgi:hypothetical protein
VPTCSGRGPPAGAIADRPDRIGIVGNTRCGRMPRVPPAWPRTPPNRSRRRSRSARPSSGGDAEHSCRCSSLRWGLQFLRSTDGEAAAARRDTAAVPAQMHSAKSQYRRPTRWRSRCQPLMGAGTHRSMTNFCWGRSTRNPTAQIMPVAGIRRCRQARLWPCQAARYLVRPPVPRRRMLRGTASMPQLDFFREVLR